MAFGLIMNMPKSAMTAIAKFIINCDDYTTLEIIDVVECYLIAIQHRRIGSKPITRLRAFFAKKFKWIKLFSNLMQNSSEYFFYLLSVYTVRKDWTNRS